MPALPAFSDAQLEAISEVLAHTEKGLTGARIAELLGRLGFDDPAGKITKRKRLFAALSARQRADRCGNPVAAFIQQAMDPVSWSGRRAEFDDRRAELNRVLAFCGMVLGEDGKLRRATAAKTLSEAEERAGRLRAELQRRRVHPEVLRFCRAEFLQDNYFHQL